MNNQNYPFHFNLNLFQNGVASSLCGIISVTAANVFDIARVQMLEKTFKENYALGQVALRKEKTQRYRSFFNSISYKFDYFRNNTFTIFKKQISDKGFRKAFFTGYSRQIQLNTMRNLTFFPLLEFFKTRYQQHREIKNSKDVLKQTLFATSVTRIINSFLLFPFEILRIERQLKNSQKISLKDILKKIYQNKSRYKTTFLRYQVTQNIASCTFFCTYEETKYKLNKYNYYKQKPFIYLYLHSSLITTFLTAFVFYPFEIMQVGSVVMNRKMKIREFFDILSAKIGRVGVLKGTTNYIVRHFISMSIFFGLYETYKMTYHSLQLTQ